MQDFELFMKEEFEMSFMGELNYFFRLQIKQKLRQSSRVHKRTNQEVWARRCEN